MNGKQRRIKQAQGQVESLIVLGDRSCTVKEAGAVATRELHLGNFQAAADIYGLILAKFPEYAEAYSNRGVAWHQMKRFDEALADYDRAIELNPGFAGVYNNRGVTLQEMKRFGDALASYDKGIALMPDNAATFNNRGLVLQGLDRLDEAVASYDRAIALHPDFANAHYNRGVALQKMRLYDDALVSCDRAIALEPGQAGAYHVRGLILASQGNMPEAERMFRKAFALRPDFPETLFNLTSIRKYQNTDHLDARNIQMLLHKPGVPPDDRECLFFCLGKIYDDCGRYDEAFECYRQANQIRNTTVSYDSKGVVEMTDRIMDVFSQDFLARPWAFASDNRSPLFIVGMPRSGTTLLANILSNHRSIATAGELTTMIEFASRLPESMGNNIPYPEAARYITAATASCLINNYELRLRRDTGLAVARVIDKHPLNFRHLGLISMLFPKAQIIHCLRHPLDTCLSNYFQRFPKYYDYSFDLGNIGHFYGEYARLMQHWREALPTRLIEVSYEDMVFNTEQLVRQTLDFLGLEWEGRCLAPHTNPCEIETSSHWQVRQPIYQHSTERWQHYEKHLAPLKEMFRLKGQVQVGGTRGETKDVWR